MSLFVLHKFKHPAKTSWGPVVLAPRKIDPTGFHIALLREIFCGQEKHWDNLNWDNFKKTLRHFQANFETLSRNLNPGYPEPNKDHVYVTRAPLLSVIYPGSDCGSLSLLHVNVGHKTWMVLRDLLLP